MSGQLEFTGERFTPECVREIRYEHMHRYVFAREMVKNLDVLDAACGEGFGTALMAETAKEVAGVDLSGEVVEHARARYRASNINFHEADCLALPFPDDTFDCVVSFETIEHLEAHDRLLAEFRRVLRPHGFLLISTPDKAVYTDKVGIQNAFHVAELYREEFDALLARHFPVCRLWGQKLLFQSVIWAMDKGHGIAFHTEEEASVSSSDRPMHDAMYLLALCAGSEQALPDTATALSLFGDAEETVYSHYQHEIRKNIDAGGILVQRDREIAALKAELANSGARRRSWWRRFLGRG